MARGFSDDHIPWCMWDLELFQGLWVPGGAAVVSLSQNKQRAPGEVLSMGLLSSLCQPYGELLLPLQMWSPAGSSPLWCIHTHEKPSTSAFSVQLFPSTMVAQKMIFSGYSYTLFNLTCSETPPCPLGRWWHQGSLLPFSSHHALRRNWEFV